MWLLSMAMHRGRFDNIGPVSGSGRRAALRLRRSRAQARGWRRARRRSCVLACPHVSRVTQCSVLACARAAPAGRCAGGRGCLTNWENTERDGKRQFKLLLRVCARVGRSLRAWTDPPRRRRPSSTAYCDGRRLGGPHGAARRRPWHNLRRGAARRGRPLPAAQVGCRCRRRGSLEGQAASDCHARLADAIRWMRSARFQEAIRHAEFVRVPRSCRPPVPASACPRVARYPIA